ncbi:sporulation integral membrane protein YtvI [Blautia obeum]|uniref:sporulation integral membrane protein YtvI n=1 Tax=Blautia obeum TaxID=40520 RepID=UPI002A7AD252|nr:sporulation integral membrane protein YtvI [Lachnospiraceae bacterium]MCI6534303.1 sporulation integral membrane protein YtvI [Lachnospiraceae bacterium]MDY2613385.1 sporulation integral membrane protein YtvI [Lachnospiraceae bacterium]MDY4206518.1 sporulation integral membrane protein YtvI [Lachnospiraceae bacterium]
MKTNFREQLKDDRPYWKVIVSLAFSLVGTLLFLYLGYKLLGFFMPFVIGWFIAYIASPVVNWLEKRVKIVKKLGSVIMIVGVLAAVCFIIYFIISTLWKEISFLIQDMPGMYRDLESGLSQIGNSMEGVFGKLPDGVQEGWHTMVANFDEMMGELMSRISEPTVSAAGRFAKSIPSVLVATIVTFISAYFFIAEREDVIRWSKKVAPDALVSRMTMVMDNLKFAVGGYLKAQLKIMVVVYIILVVGFIILNIHFSFLLGLLIALLDFLPFFGTGTALIPWAIYQFFMGNYKLVVGLVILYAVTQLVRQLIQPKLVGDSMGLRPLLTLFLLYTGYKIGGVFGMIFAVPIGMIVINLYKAGAFDYILDDIKILAEGILSLRN